MNKIPLSVFLQMYTKANRECYIEYMWGAKVLFKWLANTNIDSFGIQFPDVPENVKIPDALQGYESQELAKIIMEYSFPREIRSVELLSKIHDMVTLELMKITVKDIKIL